LLLKNSLDRLYQSMENMVYTDGGTWYDDKVCNMIGLKHYLHSPSLKSLMERVNQYFDSIKSFDDYYACMQKECNPFHVYNSIQFIVFMYKDTITNNNDIELEEVNIILI